MRKLSLICFILWSLDTLMNILIKEYDKAILTALLAIYNLNDFLGGIE